MIKSNQNIGSHRNKRTIDFEYLLEHVKCYVKITFIKYRNRVESFKNIILDYKKNPNYLQFKNQIFIPKNFYSQK
jgi:hypothetical protein